MAGLAADAEAAGVSGFGAAAVISHEGRSLFVRRNPDDYMGGLWEIPSGTVEDGESITDAVYRETNEETGLTITEITGYIGHFDYQNSRGDTTRQFNFSATVEKAEPVILTEHDAYQWASPDDLPEVSGAIRKLLSS
ncbi:NUDIX hydrolase [Kitasatospora sp. NPDC088391]|uniref:NUDIX hydrolase n=1 Tax=Kitasatospora sp. NPDC088391 TaxID=3364074 RepID=UPI003808A84A